VSDDAVVQLRQAGFRVGTGKMTVDEAVAAYGKLEQ
jgi:multiple sugar transport system substrate-binding protein